MKKKKKVRKLIEDFIVHRLFGLNSRNNLPPNIILFDLKLFKILNCRMKKKD